MSIKSTLIDFLLQNLMLRSLCVHAQKQLFLSILVNSGRIFWHYSPRVQRIIITYVTLILLHLPPALRGATWFLIISSTSREKTPEVSDQKTKTISTKLWLPLFFPKFISVGNLIMFGRGQVLYLALKVAFILNFQMQAMMTTLFYHVHQKVLSGRLLINVCF